MVDETRGKDRKGHRTQVLSLFGVHLLLALLLLGVVGFWYWRSHNTARDVALFADEAAVSADSRGYDATPFIKAVGAAQQLGNDTSLALNILLVLVLVLCYREAVLIHREVSAASAEGKALRLPLSLKVPTQRPYRLDLRYVGTVIPILLAPLGAALFLGYRASAFWGLVKALTRSTGQPSYGFTHYYMLLASPGGTAYVSLSLFLVAGCLSLPLLTWLRRSMQEAVRTSAAE